MVKEALQYLVGLGAPNLVEEAGIKFSDKKLEHVSPPLAGELEVATLTGLIEALKETVKDPAASIIIVSNPHTVLVTAKEPDAWARRRRFLEADCSADLGRFTFGQFMDPESFIIGLQTNFVSGAGEVDYVLRLASNLAAEQVSTSQDDGVSQVATTKRGVVLKSEEKVRARVKLAPYRTFREIEQPTSEFIFRLRTGGDDRPPSCALFEADGGRWKLDAMLKVAEWLKARGVTIPVVA